MVITADRVLDCSGMSCPLPIIKTKQAVDTLQTRQILKLIATDPGSRPDIDAWTRKTGNTLLNAEQENGKFIFYIQKTR
jgi:tRNA 2-thiouridine synthesizing protein A